MILLLNEAPHSSFRSLMALYTYTITTASFIEVSSTYILEIKVLYKEKVDADPSVNYAIFLPRSQALKCPG